MGLTADYLEQLQALLPPGEAWTREPEAVLTRLLAALADGLARAHVTATALIDEADWRTTTLLLPDWERVAGLPDPCVDGQAQTLQERRAWLVARMTMTGGQSRAYFIALAASLGATVTIEEFAACRAGIARAGDPLGGPEWASAWRVHLAGVPVWRLRAGVSCAGEHLTSWTTGIIECLLQRLKPAHTTLLFAYGS